MAIRFIKQQYFDKLSTFLATTQWRNGANLPAGRQAGNTKDYFVSHIVIKKFAVMKTLLR
jgi:hypothetical protein